MHSGRLNSATSSLSRALTSFRLLHKDIWDFARGINSASKGHDIDDWSTLASLVSLQAIVDIRMGRHCAEIAQDLSPYLPPADSVMAGQLSEHAWDTQVALGRGAVRILSRAAELEMYSSESPDRARELFERVIAAETALANTPSRDNAPGVLSGERARRFASLLMRHPRSPDDFSMAAQLVEQNILNMEADPSGRGVSNDVIPFYVMRAAVRRAEGDAIGAESALARARSFEAVSLLQCTYITLLEIEFETIRQMIVFSGDRESIRGRVAALVAACERSHHLQLACDARLLGAEVLTGSAREDTLWTVRRLANQSGYRMRFNDVGVLASGESAVRKFVL